MILKSWGANKIRSHIIKEYRKFQNEISLAYSLENLKLETYEQENILIKTGQNNLKPFFLYLIMYLYPNQNEIIKDKLEIEHILPKNWGGHGSWTEEDHKEYINRFGNLILLNKKINRKASDDFFDFKRKKYEESSLVEVKAISKYKVWNKRKIEEREKQMLKSLAGFIA